MDEQEIIDKLKKFLEEKCDLEIETCYFITKKVNEQYWDEIQGSGEELDMEEEKEDFSDFEDEKEEPEDIEEIEPQEKSEKKEEGKVSVKKPNILPKIG